MAESLSKNGGKTRLAFFLIVSLFLLWGVANNLNDVLIPQFRRAFTLTDLQSGLVQSAFYMGYFVFAIPASLFMRRFGYKAAVVLGLTLYAAGAFLFFPASELHDYAFFLGALFVIASGLAFLETSANPLVTVLGAPEHAEQRLNFAQAFNPLGLLIGVFIGRTFILSDEQMSAEQAAALPSDQAARYLESQSHAVQGPYLALGAGVLVWALVVTLTKFPAIATERTQGDSGAQAGFAGLFAKPHFLFGVAAQFFYVAAQVGVWSFMIRYAGHAANMSDREGADILFFSLIGFTIGRFVGTWLMGRVQPERLMAIYAASNIALMLLAVLVGGTIGLYALAATSFFMSIMFPTIFASAIRGLGPLTKSGSSFLVMAIIGGALVAPIMGAISDNSSIQVAMIAPAICFAFIFAFAALSRPPVAAATAPQPA